VSTEAQLSRDCFVMYFSVSGYSCRECVKVVKRQHDRYYRQSMTLQCRSDYGWFLTASIPFRYHCHLSAAIRITLYNKPSALYSVLHCMH